MSKAASHAGPKTRAESVAGFPEGAAGVTPPTNVGGTGGFLSDVIVKLGFVDRETVERAIEAARQPGRRVDQILLETGAVTEEELARALAERYGLDHVDLHQFEVDMSATRLISRSSALRYRAVPIAVAADKSLIVAVADPVDALAINDIEVMTKSEARRAVANGAAIDALAERLPEVGTRPPSRNDQHPVDRVSPPAPDSPMGGASRQPPDSPPATDSPAEPRPTKPTTAALTVETDMGRLEIATERTEAHAEHAEENQAADQEPGHDADSGGRDAEARNAALEAELAEAHDALGELANSHETLREQANQMEAERGRLREQVMETARESGRMREELDQVTQERDRLSAEAQQRSADFASLLEEASSAERLAEDARDRVRELEDAERRAEAARLALSEQRKESEREREQSSRLERKLRDELTSAEQRHAALERRLSGFMTAAAEAKAMAEELMAAHDAITGNDTANESDGAPPGRSEKPESSSPARNGGESGQDDRPPIPFQRPTI
jgi:Type II secretion system (T2SS), protein E, N-terminal domain